MTVPLDPRLYEDLTPSAAQTIASGLGQSLGLLGAKSINNYFLGNQLEKLGLSRELAGLDPKIQSALIKGQQQQAALSKIPYFNRNATTTPSTQRVTETGASIPTTNLQPSGSQMPQNIPTEEDIVQASLINPQVGNALGKIREAAINAQTSERKENRKFNEPKVAELNKKLLNLEIEDARFERLEDLSKNYSDKFPSRLTAAWFTKDGQINKVGQALLADEVQEFVKLVQDNLTGLKDTFGARVTNFDIDAYLRRLPSLLNSPGGRERVLRDLRLINQINRTHAKGIIDIFKENGGTDKIPYSEAENIYRDRYKDQIQAWRKEFVRGTTTTFNALPSAADNVNRTIQNKKTGEYLRSDGTNWVPLTDEEAAAFRGAQ